MMNLEQIDTSTTAGKAEVMRLAAEGRRVAARCIPGWVVARNPWVELPNGEATWDWRCSQYAIIAEPVGPGEVWCVYANGLFSAGPYGDEQLAEDRAAEFTHRSQVVRYIRADLAGEKGAGSREERLARYRQTITGEKG